jgi:hypothetical protein
MGYGVYWSYWSTGALRLLGSDRPCPPPAPWTSHRGRERFPTRAFPLWPARPPRRRGSSRVSARRGGRRAHFAQCPTRGWRAPRPVVWPAPVVAGPGSPRAACMSVAGAASQRTPASALLCTSHLSRPAKPTSSATHNSHHALVRLWDTQPTTSRSSTTPHRVSALALMLSVGRRVREKMRRIVGERAALSTASVASTTQTGHCGDEQARPPTLLATRLALLSLTAARSGTEGSGHVTLVLAGLERARVELPRLATPRQVATATRERAAVGGAKEAAGVRAAAPLAAECGGAPLPAVVDGLVGARGAAAHGVVETAEGGALEALRARDDGRRPPRRGAGGGGGSGPSGESVAAAGGTPTTGGV